MIEVGETCALCAEKIRKTFRDSDEGIFKLSLNKLIITRMWHREAAKEELKIIIDKKDRKTPTEKKQRLSRAWNPLWQILQEINHTVRIRNMLKKSITQQLRHHRRNLICLPSSSTKNTDTNSHRFVLLSPGSQHFLSRAFQPNSIFHQKTFHKRSASSSARAEEA